MYWCAYRVGLEAYENGLVGLYKYGSWIGMLMGTDWGAYISKGVGDLIGPCSCYLIGSARPS